MASLAAVATGSSACWPSASRTPSDLRLVSVVPIEAPERFQPSALALDDEHLLTVSDQHDGAIYELELGASVARARPFITFAPPVQAAQGENARLDFEGLVRVAQGQFWVLSEGRYRVLEVTATAAAPHAGQARWLTDSVEALGRAAKLFQVPGGDVEGLTRLPQGGLLIAAERQPRGLIELGSGFGLGAAQAWAMPEASYSIPSSRPADFADLTLVDGQVYALVRNAHLVVQLERSASGWREGRAWSYAAVENDPRYRYVDPKFGLAEGLVVSEHEVFIVLDNNEQARVSEPADRRPLLLRFERPRDLAGRPPVRAPRRGVGGLGR